MGEPQKNGWVQKEETYLPLLGSSGYDDPMPLPEGASAIVAAIAAIAPFVAREARWYAHRELCILSEMPYDDAGPRGGEAKMKEKYKDRLKMNAGGGELDPQINSKSGLFQPLTWIYWSSCI